MVGVQIASTDSHIFTEISIMQIQILSLCLAAVYAARADAVGFNQTEVVLWSFYSGLLA